MKASIAGTLTNSLVNGDGLRYVIFFQGCSHHCPGCHNPDTWKVKAHNQEVLSLIQQIDENLPLLDGITLSGGEPFEQPEAAFELARYAKEVGINVWAYTGYTYEQLIQPATTELAKAQQRLLSMVDVLVDGPFIESLKDDTLKFKGSSNQRILFLENGKIKRGLVEEFDN